jgi:hypothetical protein
MNHKRSRTSTVPEASTRSRNFKENVISANLHAKHVTTAEIVDCSVEFVHGTCGHAAHANDSYLG